MPSLVEIALDAAWERKTQGDTTIPPKESTYDFMARVSPHLPRSRHLSPLVEVLDRDPLSGYLVCNSTPPRHGKTTTIEHAVVRMLEQDPRLKIAYVTYAEELALSKSVEMRDLALHSRALWENAGKRPPLVLSDVQATKARWKTTEGGFFRATGIGGGLTGDGFNLIVIDDPFKDRAAASSQHQRNVVSEWFDSVAFTRRDPRGFSMLVNHTRWHEDDQIARLVKKGWPYVNLQAIDDARGALWPEYFPLETLLQIKANNEYEFSALYQGQPRSKDDAVFKGSHLFYDKLPDGPYTTSVGLDFAYSDKSTADYSVAVVLRMYGDGRVYVVDVLRMRAEAPKFKAALIAMLTRHAIISGGRRVFPKCRAFIAGTELAMLAFMAQANDGIGSVPIERMTAVGDKLTRAQAVAAAWNRGAMCLPASDDALRATFGADVSAEWVAPFWSELSMFTGIGDKHDDQVDALAGAYVPFVAAPSAPRRFGVPSGFVL